MLDFLLEPLQYSLMQRAFMVAVMVGIICAVVGSYLMVQRLALLGDAISHSLFPGLAIAYLININIYIGAFISGVISAGIINWINRRSPIKEDAAMGIVFSAFFAVGVTLITAVPRLKEIDLYHFLYGNILGVSASEVRDTLIITVLVLLSVVLLYKELLFFSFDPLGAQAAGLPVHLLSSGLMILIAMTVVASMKIVGVILVLALLITPASTAYLLVPRLHQVIVLGAVLSVFSSVTGLYLSSYYNLPSGPAIVIVASVLFALAFVFSPSQGLLTQRSSQPLSFPVLSEIRALVRK